MTAPPLPADVAEWMGMDSEAEQVLLAAHELPELGRRPVLQVAQDLLGPG